MRTLLLLLLIVLIQPSFALEEKKKDREREPEITLESNLVQLQIDVARISEKLRLLQYLVVTQQYPILAEKFSPNTAPSTRSADGANYEHFLSLIDGWMDGWT